MAASLSIMSDAAGRGGEWILSVLLLLYPVLPAAGVALAWRSRRIARRRHALAAGLALLVYLVGYPFLVRFASSLL